MNRTLRFVSESTPHISLSQVWISVKLKETFVTVMCKNSVLATSADAATFQVKLAAKIVCPQILEAFMKPFDVIRSSSS